MKDRLADAMASGAADTVVDALSKTETAAQLGAKEHAQPRYGQATTQQ